MPKKIKEEISVKHLYERLDYDPNTGLFKWLPNPTYGKNWNTRRAGKAAGNIDKKHGAVTIRLEGKLYLAHRMAVAYMNGSWPKLVIDHINGNPVDNRIINLRECTQSENMRNRSVQKNNKGGLLGVRFRPHHGKWEARINAGGKTVWRQYFMSAQEAVEARRAILPQFHGEFIRHSSD
jgi:hypothetical protein